MSLFNKIVQLWKSDISNNYDIRHWLLLHIDISHKRTFEDEFGNATNIKLPNLFLIIHDRFETSVQ